MQLTSLQICEVKTLLVCDRGKPKKGRGGPRDAKRIRVSSEQDFDYEDDPDLTL